MNKQEILKEYFIDRAKKASKAFRAKFKTEKEYKDHMKGMADKRWKMAKNKA